MIVIRIYRIAHWAHLKRIPLLPHFLKILNRVVFSVVLPPSANIGRNVLFSYEGLATIIHRRAVIGDDVTIGSGVIVGGRSGSQDVPVIERGAFIGGGAKVLGPVTIGEYASIGANAVVLTDIPPYAVAVGIPARVIRINRPEDIPDYRSFRNKQ